MTEFKNGDKVSYRMGLTFTYVGKDPYKEGHSYCIHPTTGRLDSLLTVDLSTKLSVPLSEIRKLYDTKS